MKNVDYTAMRHIAKAIKSIDEITKNETVVKSDTNVWRVEEARRHLINTIFNCGYELQHKTYRVIKSTSKRQLIKSSNKWRKSI